MNRETSLQMLKADFLPMLTVGLVGFIIFGALVFHQFETAIEAIQ